MLQQSAMFFSSVSSSSVSLAVLRVRLFPVPSSLLAQRVYVSLVGIYSNSDPTPLPSRLQESSDRQVSISSAD